jgi:hypothetical protein
MSIRVWIRIRKPCSTVSTYLVPISAPPVRSRMLTMPISSLRFRDMPSCPLKTDWRPTWNIFPPSIRWHREGKLRSDMMNKWCRTGVKTWILEEWRLTISHWVSIREDLLPGQVAGLVLYSKCYLILFSLSKHPIVALSGRDQKFHWLDQNALWHALGSLDIPTTQ